MDVTQLHPQRGAKGVRYLSVIAQSFRHYLRKVRHILPMVLAIGAATTTVPLVLRYLFHTYLPEWQIKEAIWDYWLPGAAVILLVAVWLRPRVEALVFPDRNSSCRMVVLTVAGAAVFLPAAIVQDFVPRALSQLHAVADVTSIGTERAKRYYRVDSFGLAENLLGTYSDVQRVGRFGNDLIFTHYFVMPATVGGPTLRANHTHYYGFKHSVVVSNRLPAAEKDQLFRLSVDSGKRLLAQRLRLGQEYFEVVGPSRALDGYRQAVQTRTALAPHTRIVVLTPGEGKFEDRTGNGLAWLKATSSIGLTVLLLLLAWPTMAETLRGRLDQ